MAGYNDEKKVLRCSFCNKTQDQVRKLIAGPKGKNVYICDECIEICDEILEEELEDEFKKQLGELQDKLELANKEHFKQLEEVNNKHKKDIITCNLLSYPYVCYVLIIKYRNSTFFRWLV